MLQLINHVGNSLNVSRMVILLLKTSPAQDSQKNSRTKNWRVCRIIGNNTTSSFCENEQQGNYLHRIFNEDEEWIFYGQPKNKKYNAWEVRKFGSERWTLFQLVHSFILFWNKWKKRTKLICTPKIRELFITNLNYLNRNFTVNRRRNSSLRPTKLKLTTS